MVVEQASVLRAFIALCTLRTDWAGKIVLIHTLNEAGAATAMAATIAGAVTLSIEADPERARAALRAGCCDFVVNTLDEALRTMKNEVRKGVPLSVALVADDQTIRKEINERGVVADLDTTLLPLVSAGPELQVFTSISLEERRGIDRKLLQDAGLMQARWLTAAPKFFPRDLQRWFWQVQDPARVKTFIPRDIG